MKKINYILIFISVICLSGCSLNEQVSLRSYINSEESLNNLALNKATKLFGNYILYAETPEDDYYSVFWRDSDLLVIADIINLKLFPDRIAANSYYQGKQYIVLYDLEQFNTNQYLIGNYPCIINDDTTIYIIDKNKFDVNVGDVFTIWSQTDTENPINNPFYYLVDEQMLNVSGYNEYLEKRLNQ